uniref:Uncharacterized protein n=1 Tax=Anguilla anguilla TaxID=7936 RepID=A0A0E9VFA9_ANGAN
MVSHIILSVSKR